VAIVITPAPPQRCHIDIEVAFPGGVNTAHIEEYIRKYIRADGWGESFASNYIHSERMVFTHTSAPAPEPATAPCPQHRIWQHCPVAAQVAKAERERAAKQWSDLSVWIHEQMTIAEGTEHYFTYLKIYAHIQSLRAQQEPQQEGRR